ncbi:MAG: hypothetical protein ACREDR_02160, partial [Blastocatellia bacterium]
VNIPELLQIAAQVMAIPRPDGVVDIKLPGRRDVVVSAHLSDDQRQFLSSLKRRAKDLKHVKPSEDNMLAISTDARKMSLDYRLIRPRAEDHPASKVNRLVDNVLSIHRERPDATQLIFCDLGVNPTLGGFRLYGDIIDKLVAGGLERERILDFSALTDRAKEDAIFKLQTGEAAVGLGSTDTLGTGVNVQDRCYAGHHLDAPWCPHSIEQRDGRVFRHGNMHYDMRVPIVLYRYVTEGSFDTFVWQAITSKTAFIRQILRGDIKDRVWKDIDVEEMSPAMVMAIASGNPDLLVKVNLEEDVRELESRRKLHESGQYRLRGEAVRVRAEIKQSDALLESLKSDAAHAAATTGRDFKMSVMGKKYCDRKSAGAALLSASRSSLEIAEIRGFKVVTGPGSSLYLKREARHSINANDLNGESTINSITGVLARIDGRVSTAARNLSALRANLEKVEREIGRPFRDEAKLRQKRRELQDVEKRLAAQKGDEAAAA